MFSLFISAAIQSNCKIYDIFIFTKVDLNAEDNMQVWVQRIQIRMIQLWKIKQDTPYFSYLLGIFLLVLTNSQFYKKAIPLK